MRTLRLVFLALALLVLPVGMLLLPPTRRVFGRLVTWFEHHVSRAGAPPALLPTSLIGFRLPALPVLETWLNGSPPPADSLRGRVTAIVLWRDTDPQSLWKLLEAQAWHEHLGRSGVEVIGIHLPEFAFAADSAVPAAAIRRLGVTFPIGLDPGLRTWKVLGPHAGGSRLLIVGREGRIVFDERGEGVPMASGRAITRAVLGHDGPPMRVTGGAGPGPHPAIHLGGARVTRGPLVGLPTGQPHVFPAVFRSQIEGEAWTPHPVGSWMPGADGATAGRGGAATMMALRYSGPALSVVMSPPATGPTRVWFLRDERWLGRGDAGADLQFDHRGAASVWVDRPRLYTLTVGGVGMHVAKLSPEDPGLTIYTFHFTPGPGDGPRQP